MIKRDYSIKAVNKIYSLQGRYAAALFSAAIKSNKLNEVEAEMTKIKSFIGKNSDIQNFLENPSIGREGKKKVVESLLSKQKYSELVINLFRVMADNGRLDNSLKVISSFEQIMKDHHSEISVKIISHKTLPKDVQSKLEGLVQNKFISNNKTSKIIWEVNDNIRGGLIIEIGDNIIDMSVASKTISLQKELVSSL